jgi:hypothetical protein
MITPDRDRDAAAEATRACLRLELALAAEHHWFLSGPLRRGWRPDALRRRRATRVAEPPGQSRELRGVSVRGATIGFANPSPSRGRGCRARRATRGLGSLQIAALHWDFPQSPSWRRWARIQDSSEPTRQCETIAFGDLSCFHACFQSTRNEPYPGVGCGPACHAMALD